MRAVILAIAIGFFGFVPSPGQTPPARTPHRGGWLVGRTHVDQFHESYFYRVATGQPKLLGWRLGVATNLFGLMSTVEGIVKADGTRTGICGSRQYAEGQSRDPQEPGPITSRRKNGPSCAIRCARGPCGC